MNPLLDDLRFSWLRDFVIPAALALAISTAVLLSLVFLSRWAPFW